jgi:hypothetical protein
MSAESEGTDLTSPSSLLLLYVVGSSPKYGS